MSNDDSTDLLLTGALFAGAGVVGFFGARWLARPRAQSAPSTASASPVAPVTTPPPELPAPAVVAAPATSSPAVGQPTAAPSAGLSRRFDPIFERHRGTLPIELLRALAMRESAMNPGSKGRAAWGLLQITEKVRADFNETHKTNVTRDQLLDPETNVRIATWLLRRIVAGYARHGDLPNMRADWDNPRFAQLAVFGWNAGWSQGGGVGRVADWLKRKGARDVDIDLIHENAREAGAATHLSNAAKVRWSKGVVALYLRERALAARPTDTPSA